MWVLREIEALGGEVGFRDFMELALYHPEHGYYAAGETPWGRDRDFLTAPSASGWYGATVARLLTEAAGSLGAPVDLVDLAAGDGSFLGAVLDALGGDGPETLGRVVAVERSPAMRTRAAQRLAAVGLPVEIAASLPPATERPVVVHASELYDAMPVHRVEQTAGGLVELTVAVEGDGLEWRRRPAGGDLEGYFSSHRVVLEEGQIAEANLAAEPFHRAVLDGVGEGLALVLDYGYGAARLYDPRGRRHGSLASYRRHELGRDPLDAPGGRDLTAHVNFDDLCRAAASRGWEEIAFIPLAEFLVRAGLGGVLDEQGLGMDADLDAETVTARQEVKRLLDPEGMGSDLKMLIQGRGALAEVAKEILSREL